MLATASGRVIAQSCVPALAALASGQLMIEIQRKARDRASALEVGKVFFRVDDVENIRQYQHDG